MTALDRLRKQRAEQLGPKSLVLAIPGYDDLYVRYQPVEWDALGELLADAGGTPAEALSSNVKALSTACGAILVRLDDEEHEGVERDRYGRASLADVLRAQGESVHGEVRFDGYLVDVLGLKVEDVVEGSRVAMTAQEILVSLFAGVVSPELGIAEQAARLGAWVGSSTREVDAGLGE